MLGFQRERNLLVSKHSMAVLPAVFSSDEIETLSDALLNEQASSTRRYVPFLKCNTNDC